MSEAKTAVIEDQSGETKGSANESHDEQTTGEPTATTVARSGEKSDDG